MCIVSRHLSNNLLTPGMTWRSSSHTKVVVWIAHCFESQFQLELGGSPYREMDGLEVRRDVVHAGVDARHHHHLTSTPTIRTPLQQPSNRLENNRLTSKHQSGSPVF